MKEKMPAKSGKQYRMMQAIAHGGLKSTGPDKAIAKEFTEATPKSKRLKWSKKKKPIL